VLEAGINFIDTADVYLLGESEEIVGKALAGRRDQVVVPPGTDLRAADNYADEPPSLTDKCLRRH
jgi:aryl-alcohol dehydrogenase-like predicted oxidoreductase